MIKGSHHTKEAKHKISKKAKGKKASPETRLKMSISRSGSNNYFLGKHHTEEHNQRFSESRKGKCIGDLNPAKRPEVRKKISLKMKGRILSNETKKKISEARVGRFCGESHPLYGIPRSEETKRKISKTQTQRGVHKLEKNGNWHGGLSFEPYCNKFNETLKEQIRSRDTRSCQLCGKSEPDNGRKLDVHHIHYDKENCKPDLIALCLSCNSKVNFNRDYYEELFMNKLTQKDGLN